MTLDPRQHLFDLARKLSLRAPGPLVDADVTAIHHELDVLGAKKDAEPIPLPAGAASVLGPGPSGLTNEEAFYKSLRSSLFPKGLSEPQVAGVKALLAAMSTAKWPLAYAAYGLATPYLETARTMQPIKEYGGPAYFHKMYDIGGSRPNKARELGNLSPGDGAKYCGRGYPQLTGKSNYAKAGAKLGVDLVNNPDLAMQPDIAAKIMIWGMSEGAFTGKSMASYLPNAGPAQHTAFEQARRIINGQDRAGEIAGFAMKFQEALQAGGWK